VYSYPGREWQCVFLARATSLALSKACLGVILMLRIGVGYVICVGCARGMYLGNALVFLGRRVYTIFISMYVCVWVIYSWVKAIGSDSSGVLMCAYRVGCVVQSAGRAL
jgi:hypothetical protein